MSSSPCRVSVPMRAATSKMVSRNGTHRITTQSTEPPKAAPATVAVTTAEGSRSAAPVTRPGPMRRSEARISRPVPGGGCAWGKRTTFEGGFACPLGDPGEFTLKVSLDAALVPQTQRAAVRDDPEGGDRGQQEPAADAEEELAGAGARDDGDHLGIRRRDQQGHGEHPHAQAGEQAGDVLGP